MLEEMAYVTDADRTPYLQLWNPLPHQAALGPPLPVLSAQCSLVTACLWGAPRGPGCTGVGERREAEGETAGNEGGGGLG